MKVNMKPSITKYLQILLPVLISLYLAGCVSDVSLADPQSRALPIRTVEYLSDPYEIRQKYKSMQGPSSKRPIIIGGGAESELVWITGYRTQVVDMDGVTPVNQDFLCHNNLDLRPGHKNNLSPTRPISNGRLFTLSQGVFSTEFPPGFGIPVMSHQILDLTTQVLNHNIEDPNIVVRHKVMIDYVRDQDVVAGMTPLIPASAYVVATLDGKKSLFGASGASGMQRVASCLPGTHATGTDKSNIFYDQSGKKFTGHWVVPLGQETRRTLVTEMLNLNYDSKIHYVAIHVHPFSESLELRDLTLNKSVLKTTMRSTEKGIGLAQVDDFVSLDGVPIFKDHDYELVSHYHNTSGVTQDAMAVMLIYVEDKEFDRAEWLGEVSKAK